MSTGAVLDSLHSADFSRAEELLASVEASDPRYVELRTMCTVLAQPFTYALAVMLGDADPKAEPTTRSLTAVQAALARVGGRIEALVAALTNVCGARPSWAPTVTALAPTPDGTLKLEGTEDALALTWLLRREWTRLNWLLVCVGARTLTTPSAIAAPPEPLEYLDTLLSARFNLLVDHAAGKPLTLEDDLDRGMAESRWGGAEGTLLTELPPQLAEQWLEESAAAIAAIRWLREEHASAFDGFDG